MQKRRNLPLLGGLAAAAVVVGATFVITSLGDDTSPREAADEAPVTTTTTEADQLDTTISTSVTTTPVSTRPSVSTPPVGRQANSTPAATTPAPTSPARPTVSVTTTPAPVTPTTIPYANTDISRWPEATVTSGPRNLCGTTYEAEACAAAGEIYSTIVNTGDKVKLTCRIDGDWFWVFIVNANGYVTDEGFLHGSHMSVPNGAREILPSCPPGP